jgi:hypothetical protein
VVTPLSLRPGREKRCGGVSERLVVRLEVAGRPEQDLQSFRCLAANSMFPTSPMRRSAVSGLKCRPHLPQQRRSTAIASVSPSRIATRSASTSSDSARVKVRASSSNRPCHRSAASGYFAERAFCPSPAPCDIGVGSVPRGAGSRGSRRTRGGRCRSRAPGSPSGWVDAVPIGRLFGVCWRVVSAATTRAHFR